MYKTIFVNTDNAIIITVTDDTGTPYTFIDSGVSKIEFIIGDVVFSSESENITYNNSGVITMVLGNSALLTPMAMYLQYPCKIKVYDPVHTNGMYLSAPSIKNTEIYVELRY